MNEPEQFALPKRWGTLRPKFIISLVAILAFLGIVVGYIEINQSRKDVMALLRKEAETVTEALSVSAENAVQAYGEIEAYIENHLFNTALLLNHLEKEKSLSQAGFETLMRESGVAKAFYVTAGGNIKNFAYPETAIHGFKSEKVADFIEPLLTQNIDRSSGLVEDWEGQVHFTVALRSTAQTAWVLCANPSALIDLRKRIGIGRLIQDIGENEEIAYIVLQDEKGIISATKNVDSMASLGSDPFSGEAVSKGRLMTRITSFNNQEVFEAVKPLQVNGDVLGLIRTGLRMDAANKAVTRTIQRAIAVIFGFIVIGVILFNFLVTNQNYALLTEAFSKIKTYTGNILDNMADAVVAVNREGRITVFNRAAETLFARSPGEALGKSCRDIIGSQTSLLDEALTTGNEIRDREADYRLNEHNAVLSVTTTLLRRQNGEIDSAVAVIKDLTEKKAYEARLRRQEKLTAMGELASGVAHEIRNPLNAISIIAQRFAYEFQPLEKEAEYHELANSVVSATRQVSSIIERFLEFARPPALNLQQRALNEVAEQAVKLVENQAKEKGVSLRYAPNETIELPVDGSQMEQVFLNILQNALHVTPAKGEITLRLYRHHQEAVVEISDTGAGIPPEHLNRIFDLYFTTKENGTGMGLSISQRIVSEHEGRIDVESEMEQGTIFRIYLPVKKSDDVEERIV